MNTNTKPSLNKRALTSMFMVFSFLLLPLSGIPLHYSRMGGVPSTLEHFLMSVHNMSAFIFVIAVIVHLSLNWNALTKYIAKKTTEYIRFKKEMLFAFITVLLLVGLFSMHAFHVH